MSVISGIGGLASAGGVSIPLIRTWQIASKKANLSEVFHASTKGASEQVLGNKDWNGSFTCYGGLPVALPGEALVFLGSIEGTVGATGTAIVDSVDISADIEGGKPQEHTVNFSGNGALTLGAAVAADPAVSLAPTSIGCKVELGTVITTPVWTAVTDVRNWKLTLSRANSSYGSSSTAGLIQRVKGNLSAAISYSAYCATFAALPAEGTETSIRLYTTASLFWEINYAKFGEVSGLLTDREGAGLVGATFNLAFQAIGNLNGTTPTMGTIKTPTPSTWWP